MKDPLLLPLVAAWLSLCAAQDWRRRAVPNTLTLPPLGLAILLRLAGWIDAPLLPSLAAMLLLLLLWRLGWLGGADLKASLALALLDVRLLAWAWAGLGLWYLLLRPSYSRADVRRLPGFVGFLSGVLAYWVIRLGVYVS